MSDVPLPNIPEKYKFTPEFRLLAACSWIAPPALEQDQAQKIAALCRGGIDWARFLALVRRHGVPSLAYTTLSRHAAGRLPIAVSDKLKSWHIQASGLALRHAAEIAAVSTLFSEHDIDMMLMKGEILSLKLYGDPTLRSASDIDLLVKSEDFDRADQLILSMGYRCYSPGSGLTEKQKKFHRSVGQNYEYSHVSKGVKLELHWRSYLWNQEQTGELWAHYQSIDWIGKPFKFWNDDALFLFLCYHGAHHEWCSLKWLSDVAVLIAQGRPDGWDSLLALADQLGMNRVLAQSALLAAWLYGVQLPLPFQELINREEQVTAGLCVTALKALLQSSEELATVGRRMDDLRHSMYIIRLMPSIPWFGMIKKVSINSVDFKEFPLPDTLFWLYLPLRPVFWFWRNYVNLTKSVKNQ